MFDLIFYFSTIKITFQVTVSFPRKIMWNSQNNGFSKWKIFLKFQITENTYDVYISGTNHVFQLL